MVAFTPQVVAIGTVPGDKTGDGGRTSFTKINDNFAVLFNAFTIDSTTFDVTFGGAFAGPIVTNDTTDSISTITGSGIFAGGLGVAKKIFAGNEILIEAGLTGIPALRIRADAGNGNVPRIYYSGNQNFRIRDETAGVDRFLIDIAGIVSIPGVFSVDNTTEATSTTNASIHTDGGLGVAKKSFFGDELIVRKDQTAITRIAVDNAGTGSANTRARFSLFDGGTEVGWMERRRDGSGENVFGVSADTIDWVWYKADETTRKLRLQHDGDFELFSGKFIVDDGTDSTSTTTGSGVFSGGLGVAKSMFIGGDIRITSGRITMAGSTSQAIDASTSSDLVARFQSTDGVALVSLGDNTSVLDGNQWRVTGNVMTWFTNNALALTIDAAQKATFQKDATVKGLFSLDTVGAALVISAGVVTVTRSYHKLDTEGFASTDDLTTINGGPDGSILVLRQSISVRNITVKDGTGNLLLAGDFLFGSTLSSLTLIREANDWVELSRSIN